MTLLNVLLVFLNPRVSHFLFVLHSTTLIDASNVIIDALSVFIFTAANLWLWLLLVLGLFFYYSRIQHRSSAVLIWWKASRPWSDMWKSSRAGCKKNGGAPGAIRCWETFTGGYSGRVHGFTSHLTLWAALLCRNADNPLSVYYTNIILNKMILKIVNFRNKLTLKLFD